MILTIIFYMRLQHKQTKLFSSHIKFILRINFLLYMGLHAKKIYVTFIVQAREIAKYLF